MRRWILFCAEPDSPEEEVNKLKGARSLNDVLYEHLDSSDGQLPQEGYRPTESICLEQFVNPHRPGSSTHYYKSNWVVTRTEEYIPDIPVGMKFDSIVVCYCKYDPICPVLYPYEKPIVSVDSFGGDEQAFKDWLDSQSDEACSVHAPSLSESAAQPS